MGGPARPPTGLIKGHSAASSTALILLGPRASDNSLPDDGSQQAPRAVNKSCSVGTGQYEERMRASKRVDNMES